MKKIEFKQRAELRKMELETEKYLRKLKADHKNEMTKIILKRQHREYEEWKQA